MSRVISDITHISRCGTQFRNRLLEPLGLTVRPASMLLVICANPGISQDGLSRRVFLNKSVVARQLTALEADGLVERIPCPTDKRTTQLHATEKGMALRPRLQEIWSQWDSYLTQDLTPEQAESLKTLLIALKSRAAQWIEGD